MATLQYGVKI